LDLIDLHELEVFVQFHSEELFVHLSPIDIELFLDVVKLDVLFSWFLVLEEIVDNYLVFLSLIVIEVKNFTTQVVKKVVTILWFAGVI
jgi:hypothetical protein